MITKKLVHDVQTWLNSIYNFSNPSDEKNKHIISEIQNFAFRFICVDIRIWTLRADGSLYRAEKYYTKNIKSEQDFIEFKDKVNSTIDNYIKIAIDETNKNKENA